MLHFYTFWKHLGFFTGEYRKATPGCNGLITSSISNSDSKNMFKVSNKCAKTNVQKTCLKFPLNTKYKLNVYKTFNLRPVSKKFTGPGLVNSLFSEATWYQNPDKGCKHCRVIFWKRHLLIFLIYNQYFCIIFTKFRLDKTFWFKRFLE